MSAPMRVAMVCARALPLTGGVETHVDEVSRRLSAMGSDVTVLTTDPSGELPALETRNGYRIRRWPSYPRSRDFYFSPGLASHLRDNSQDYDIVHIQGVHSLVAPMALRAMRTSAVPLILTFHSGGHSSAAREFLRPLQWRLMAPLLRSTTALVAVSDFERERFADALKIAATRIRLIQNGCTALPIDSGPALITGAPLLVSVGRLERYKGHHRLLNAMPAILRQAPEARLAVVGSGPYERDLRKLATRLGVGDRVVIRGFGADDRARLGRLVSDADVMCLLSDYEAHPVAVLEAISCGTGVLAGDNSGLSELGRRGLVTTIPLTSSPDRIAAAALDVARQPRAVAPSLPSWDGCVERLADLYRECVS